MLDAKHDNVVSVYSADTEESIPVIRMEYLPRGSVADRFGGSPAPVAEAVHVVEEACRGVEALHARGVLHRDLKPANLLIGDAGRIKVSDFGLACRLASVGGAPPWGYTEHLPPEAHAAGGTIETLAGDVYALGVTLYRLLNGDALMRSVAASAADIPALVSAGKYPDRRRWAPHLHDSLRRVARKAMHPNPASRYQSASDLRHALEGVHPTVSWARVGSIEDATVWEGTNVAGSIRVRARLGTGPRGRQVFELARQGPSGAFRTSRADGFRSDSIRDAAAHAATVLQRVAVQGR
jgi:serine/threonine-protein kinase